MNDANEQLATLQANNTADATALAALEADLTTPAEDTVGDQVLAAALPVITTAGLVSVFGADALVSALQAENYTVTAPTDDSTDTES
jgi:hypothetical protein